MGIKLIWDLVLFFFLLGSFITFSQAPSPGVNTQLLGIQTQTNLDLASTNTMVSPTPSLLHDTFPTPTPTTKPSTVQNTPTPLPHQEITIPPPTSFQRPSQSGSTSTASFDGQNLPSAQQIIQRNQGLQRNNQQIRQNFIQSIQAKRVEAIKMAVEKRRVFKAQLSALKDQRKKTVVENIDNKISFFNQNHVEKMVNALDSLQQILDKISSQSSQLKAKSINTATLDTSVANAQNAIASAKTQVLNQASKEYVATISGETKLKAEVGVTVSQFRLDLQTANKSIIEAKQAVHNAASELAKLVSALKNSPNLDTSATNSGFRP